MIPFVRILNYGNVLAKIEIVDVVTTYGNVFVIYSDGKIYGMGDNSSGELGQGNTLDNYRNVWAEITVPNIKYITCAQSSIVYVTKDNKVYYTGSNLIFASTSNVTVPTDITSRFSTFNLSEDEVMCGSRGMFVLRANGDLYACGQGTNASASQYGNVGLGSASSSTFKLLASGVRDVYSSISGASEASFYIKTNGDLYSTGRNGYGACGVGFASEQPTFTKVNTVFDSAIAGIFCSNSASSVCTVNGTIYSCGSRSGAQYGDGVTNGSTSTTFLKNNVVNITSVVQFSKSFFNNDANYIGSPSGVYCSGADYYGQFGFGNTAYTLYWTYTNQPTIDASKFRAGGYFNYTWIDNKLYACGHSGWIPGLSSNTGVYTMVPIQPRVL